MKSFCLVVGLSSMILLCGEAFVSPSYTMRHPREVQSTSYPGHSIESSLSVKRRRRRRDNDRNESDVADDGTLGDLPDFELDDDEEVSKTKSQKRMGSSNPDVITPSMMGSSDGPVRSIKDLLTDRSLEAKLDFEDVEQDDSLPDLIAMTRSSQQQDGAVPGTKKARQTERRAAAMAAKEAEEESVFSNLPFVTNTDGKIQPLKVLEAGAWGGIFLLVGWEIYLNSPFFDRAAPMAPVVFESLLM